MFRNNLAGVFRRSGAGEIFQPARNRMKSNVRGGPPSSFPHLVEEAFSDRLR